MLFFNVSSQKFLTNSRFIKVLAPKTATAPWLEKFPVGNKIQRIFC